MNAWFRGFKNGLFAMAALPLPLALTLHDGDLSDQQVFLTTSPPHSFEYRCKLWEIDEKRDGHRIELRVLGLVKQGGLHFCATVMDPVPIVSRMAALTRPGVYRLEFSRAWPGSTPTGTEKAPPSDVYRLELTDGSISFEPEGKPTLTAAASAGKFLRVPEDWLLVDVEFMDPDSRKKLSPVRDEILKAIAGLGGRAFEPAAGNYLFGESPVALPKPSPAKGEHDRIGESYYFHYTGDFSPLDKLMAKYAKHSQARPGKPYFAVWTRMRSHSSSTYLHAR